MSATMNPMSDEIIWREGDYRRASDPSELFVKVGPGIFVRLEEDDNEEGS